MAAITPILSTWESNLITKHKRLIGVLIPACIAHMGWWALAIRYNFFSYFPKTWPMVITMIFGGLIAGGTSEGGGAVAFPVMTLLLGIEPNVARDFALGIQTSGMTCATFTLLFMGVHVEWHSIVCCGIGSLIGMIVGFEYVAPVLKPDWKKMAFVGVSTSFAIALFILNREKKRKTFDWVQSFGIYRVLVLFCTGIIGGLFTAFLGSGADLCSFVTLTLLYLVSEKVATPTSVVLMATISQIGVFYRNAVQDGFSQEAKMYLACCAPVVFIMAPTGSMITSHFHRQSLAALIYILEFLSFVTGFAVVRPSWQLSCVTLAVLVIGAGLFWLMSRLGKKLHGLSTSNGAADCEMDSLEESQLEKGQSSKLADGSLTQNEDAVEGILPTNTSAGKEGYVSQVESSNATLTQSSISDDGDDGIRVVRL